LLSKLLGFSEWQFSRLKFSEPESKPSEKAFRPSEKACFETLPKQGSDLPLQESRQSEAHHRRFQTELWHVEIGKMSNI
jgi:hypothetical protein